MDVRLVDPRVQQLRLDGVTGQDARNLERITGLVVQEALQGYALLTLDRQALPFGIKVRQIAIGDDAIKVSFE